MPATRSPKVPTTNGVAANTKTAVPKLVGGAAAKANGTAAQLNGHAENGNAGKVIDLSAD